VLSFPARRIGTLVLLASLAVLGAGCGAYFNTYYNAEKAFEKAERTLANSGAKSARANYDDCLKISSKLLQFYPESRWVDDTILLVGICYVRMEQQRRALRKFDELEGSFPDSPLLPRTRIWRARAHLELENESACLDELSRLDLDALSRAERVEALRVQADLFRAAGNQERLVETLDRLEATARKNLDKAAIHLDLAAVHEGEGHWEEALRHYNAVRRNRPLRGPLLASWLGTLDNQLRLGRLDAVERRLAKLEKDERFYEERHALHVRQGWLRERRGDLPEARARWAKVLKEFPRTASSAAASHSLGRAFLFQDGQLDSARVYFKRTAGEKNDSPWADSSAQALLLVEALDRTHKEVDRLDGLLGRTAAGLDPDSVRRRHAESLLPRLRARQDSLRRAEATVVDSLAQGGSDSLAGGRDSLALAATPFQGDGAVDPDPRNPGRAQEDSLRSPQARKGASRVRLFDFQRKEREAMRADSLREAQRQDSLRLVEETRQRRSADSLLVAAVLDTLTHRPPIDSLRLGAVGDSLAQLRFDQLFYLAELQQRRLGRPQLADSLLGVLAADTRATPEQAARLRYSRGVLRLDAFSDSSGWRDLREVVERWPLSLSANPARDRLGLPRAASREDSAAVLLQEAEALARSGADPLRVLDSYQALAERHRGTPQEAAALLAAAELALRELENLALARVYYRQLIRRHPDHPAAAQARGRLGQSAALAVEDEEEVEEAPVLALSQVQLDEEGGFVDPDAGKPVADRLQALRERFRDVPRLPVELNPQ
jgi:TolA-binding protein